MIFTGALYGRELEWSSRSDISLEISTSPKFQETGDVSPKIPEGEGKRILTEQQGHWIALGCTYLVPVRGLPNGLEDHWCVGFSPNHFSDHPQVPSARLVGLLGWARASIAYVTQLSRATPQAFEELLLGLRLLLRDMLRRKCLIGLTQLNVCPPLPIHNPMQHMLHLRMEVDLPYKSHPQYW